MASRFVWHELMTTDPAAASIFYAKVLGWTAKDSGLADRAYSILSTADAPFGGLMALPPRASQAGAKPGWIGYVGVADVDALSGRIEATGGTIHHAPEDIPGVGRFAVVADPEGAPFAIFKGGPEAEPPEPAPEALGRPSWHELHTTDRESAFAFYSGLFGWAKADRHDMGESGIYQLFAIDGAAGGGMFNHKGVEPHPFWLFYFNVAEIHASAALVATHGGKVVAGPHEVPGGGHIIHCTDPQGAKFALVAPPRSY
ncbi:MAG: VOC family protein [Acetobacteraceae bacterium]